MPPYYFPKKMNHRHHALLRELASGCTNIEAAQLTGFTKERVSQLRQWPLFSIELEMQCRDISQHHAVAEGTKQAVAWKDSMGILDSAMPDAARKLVHLVENAESETVQHRSALDILKLRGVEEERQEAPRITVNVNVKAALSGIVARVLSGELDAPEHVREAVLSGT